MMNPIPDFTDDERHTVTQTLLERYRRMVPIEVGEAEIQVDSKGKQLTECPVIYWEGRGAHFVVFKLGDNRFRGQFFYSEAQQYGTGHDSFDSIGDCVVTLLQVQSDHERQMAGLRSGLAQADLVDQEHDGPIII
jgi:hypothetical protein